MSVAMPSGPPGDEPIVEFADAGAWERWLEEREGQPGGVWLQLAKRGAPRTTVSYGEALDVALCHGWIDGQKRRFDEHFWLQRFTPRGPRSRWSQVNTEHAERLIAAGRMRPAGRAAIEAARRDGRWEQAYEPQSRATPDEDFRAALAAEPAAEAFFAGLRSADRYAFLYRLRHTRDAAARAARIEQYVALLAAGRTLRD